MMKTTIRIAIAGMLALLFADSALAQQQDSDTKLTEARRLLNNYREASLFRDLNTGGYDPSWESIFKESFAAEKIIFDIPFRVAGAANRPAPTLSDPDVRVVNRYGQMVTPDEYIEIVKSAYNYFFIDDFSFGFSETGFDTTDLAATNKMQFEVRKSFSNSDWAVGDAASYIIEIDFSKEVPKISAIRPVDENISRANLLLNLVNVNLNPNEVGYQLRNAVIHVRLEFEESINNRKVIAVANTQGQVNLGLIPNMALLKIDTAYIPNGERFSVPPEWKIAGKPVNSQPAGGFNIAMAPWQWNGFSWAGKTFGGIIRPGSSNLVNFSETSGFKNRTGVQLGFGLEISKLWNFQQISTLFNDWWATDDYDKIAQRKKSFAGIGSGISYFYYEYRMEGNSFAQNPYAFSDRLGFPVEIIVSGSSYKEKVMSNGVFIPLFAEYRRILPKSYTFVKALSVQAGYNILIPFETKYEISGTFSRHGLYDFNTKPVTGDTFYNYYTNQTTEIKDDLPEAKSTRALMLKLNGYIDLSKGKSDNLLDIGLMVALPMKSRSATTTGAYYLAAGNDDFQSMDNAKSRIYNYFFGISIGYNFINLRVE
jgi:hypothetical protein